MSFKRTNIRRKLATHRAVRGKQELDPTALADDVRGGLEKTWYDERTIEE